MGVVANKAEYLVVFITGNTWRHNEVLVNIVAANALVLKHQAISSHNADLMPTGYHDKSYFKWVITPEVLYAWNVRYDFKDKLLLFMGYIHIMA